MPKERKSLVDANLISKYLSLEKPLLALEILNFLPALSQGCKQQDQRWFEIQAVAATQRQRQFKLEFYHTWRIQSINIFMLTRRSSSCDGVHPWGVLQLGQWKPLWWTGSHHNHFHHHHHRHHDHGHLCVFIIMIIKIIVFMRRTICRSWPPEVALLWSHLTTD